MESEAAILIKTRMASPCLLQERERFPVHMRKHMVRDMIQLAHIDSLTSIVGEWSVTRGPSHAQFRHAAPVLANVSGLGFNADAFEALDRFRNKDRAFYDSMPYTNICEIITGSGLTRLKAYALISHWSHHRMLRESMFTNLDEQEKREQIRAEKDGITLEQVQIRRDIKSTKTQIAALERKLEPAKIQLAKYTKIVDELMNQYQELSDRLETLETQDHSIRIID